MIGVEGFFIKSCFSKMVAPASCWSSHLPKQGCFGYLFSKVAAIFRLRHEPTMDVFCAIVFFRDGKNLQI